MVDVAEVTGLKKVEVVTNDREQDFISTYGTIDCGLETMSGAWTTLQHVFSVGGHGSTAEACLNGGRFTPDLLNQHPVDLLVVERGHFFLAPKVKDLDKPSKWEMAIQRAMEEH